MSVKKRAKHILAELKGHAPFTLFGALLGIFFMLVFKNTSGVTSHRLFSVFHPGHVILSAMVTASMFKLHSTKKRFFLVLLVGYFGSIGIATLSDIIIPHIGSELLGLDVPTHAHIHEQVESSDKRGVHDNEAEHHGSKIHLGFIEEWYIVNPAAFLGVLIAYFLPRTKFPHAGHVLVSTWASSSYLLMSLDREITSGVFVGIFVILFIATWLPCCISDIVFPLLFVKSDIEVAAPCPVHGRHSHSHIRTAPEQDK